MTAHLATEPARETLLVVEDDNGLRGLLVEELRDAGYGVLAAKDAEKAWELLRAHRPLLVISDLRLPGPDGLALLERIRALPMPPGFIVITAFGTVAQAVQALKQGADDFLTKPLDLDHLQVSCRRAVERRRLRQEVAYYRSLLGSGDFHGMIGRSPAMRLLFEQIPQIARAAGPVLVTGESGVGKELVARALHAESERAAGPFVALNCAGIPSELLESELFGHAAGAFTGAQRARKGLFEEADGGTLLLDEISELPLEMQSTLLRVLQDGRVRPVGANQERSLDVRIIAATNRDLEREVGRKTFREDLFYRLDTFALRVPPLRERGDDLELLAGHFIDRFGAALGRSIHGISAAALEKLERYRFPGNVRELANAVERAVTFCHEAELDVQHLPERIQRAPDAGTDMPPGLGDVLWSNGELPSLEQVESRYIQHVLRAVQGNKRRAADILGIGRRTLYRRAGLESDE